MEISRITFTSKDIHCSICKNIYTAPGILPCLHSFCHKCLMGLASKEDQGLTIMCPECKTGSHVTDIGCIILPTNLHILGLIQLYNVKEDSNRKCLICRLSGNTSDATHLCLTCDDLLCGPCSKGHNSSTVTASHRVVVLGDILKGKYDREIYNKVVICCEKHAGEEYMLCCNDCGTMICIKCALGDHRKHSHNPLAEVIKAKQKSLRERLRQVLSDKEQVIKTIEERIIKIEQNQKEFEHKLHMEVASVIDQLHREKKEVIEKAKTCFAEDKKRLNELRTSVMKSSALEDMYSLVISKGGAGFAMMSGTLEKGVEILQKSASDDLSNFKEIVPTIKGISAKETLMMMLENVQESKHLKTTDPPSGEHCGGNKAMKKAAAPDAEGTKENPSVKKKTTSEVREKQTHSNFTNASSTSPNVAVILDYEKDFVAKVSKDSLQPAINSLSLYAGKLLLVDTNNMKIKMYTVEGRLWNLLPGRSTIMPERAVLLECLVGISDGKLIIYSPPKSELKPITEIQLPGNSPIDRPVICRYKDDQVLVANLPNNKIKVFTNKGNLVQTRKTQAKGPIVSVQWNNTDKIVMCSWQDEGSVHIESSIGDLLLKVHKLLDGTRLPQWRPVDACLSSLGFIVVADTMRMELCVFDPQGTELMVLDTREDDFTDPRCLQIDEEDNLFVSGKDGLIVQYKLSCYSVAYTKLTSDQVYY